jgi:hypothetical protein
MYADAISERIKAELLAFSDPLIKPAIEALLIPPRPVLRGWDYGPPDQKFICWQVMEDPDVGTGIAFCEEGFGPRCPWGLVWLDETGARSNMGMDSGWFTTFLDAFADSFSATRLNIYQVVATLKDGTRTFLTEEAGWDETWEQVMALRAVGTDVRYDCETTRFPSETSA